MFNNLWNGFILLRIFHQTVRVSNNNVLGRYLLSEGLPEACQARRGKGSARNAAHNHRQPTVAGSVGLERLHLAQFAAGQMGFVSGAVDRVLPVGGLLPAGKHPVEEGGDGSNPLAAVQQSRTEEKLYCPPEWKLSSADQHEDRQVSKQETSRQVRVPTGSRSNCTDKVKGHG